MRKFADRCSPNQLLLMETARFRIAIAAGRTDGRRRDRDRDLLSKSGRAIARSDARRYDEGERKQKDGNSCVVDARVNLR